MKKGVGLFKGLASFLPNISLTSQKKQKNFFLLNFNGLHQDKINGIIPMTPTNEIKPIRKFKIFNHEWGKYP